MIGMIHLFLAGRYLKAKKTDGFISLISLFSLFGIALGVAALIVVMAVMNGFRTELTKKIVSFDGDIGIYSLAGYIEDYENYIDLIKQNKNIKMAFPIIEKQVLVSSGEDNTFGVLVRAMRFNDLSEKKIISDNLIFGKLELSEDEIIIGKTLADKLQVRVGMYIRMISPETTTTVIGKIPRYKKFRVAGIFAAGMSEYDSSSIFISMEAGQKMFKLNNVINIIEIHSDNPQDSDKVKLNLANILPHDFVVNDWKTKNLAFFSALKTERVVMFLILTLIIIVASFNIVSSLIMLVKEKNSNIAILRTMGATKLDIVKIFLICGVILGFLGTLVGVILGVSFSYNISEIKIFLENLTNSTIFDPLIYYLSELPAEIRVNDVIQIISISLGLSFLATIYPALRAASIDPVRILREK